MFKTIIKRELLLLSDITEENIDTMLLSLSF